MFAPIPSLPSRLVLPGAEGYTLCGPCDRWVARENTHCDKCNNCTSKVPVLGYSCRFEL
jgi:hypothetical protein